MPKVAKKKEKPTGSLMERMMKSSTIKSSSLLSKSLIFNQRDEINTNLPILNVAFTGRLNGGWQTGLTILAGQSKTFKTLFSLYGLKAYLDKYSDAIGILYDSEWGITDNNLKMMGIDKDRVIHTPIRHVEELKFDIVKRLDSIERGDHVFIMIDSLGALASKKEIEDAENEHSVADMSRAKAIKSLYRIINSSLVLKDIPCVVINHVYKTQEMHAKTIVSGGDANIYTPSQVFIITRAQEKDDDELTGFRFMITVEKSRLIKEKSKLAVNVSFTNGIEKYSGILDLALESGDVTKPKMGWYALVDNETGEELEPFRRESDTNTEDFLGVVLNRPKFQEFVEEKYTLQPQEQITGDIVEDELHLADEETPSSETEKPKKRRKKS